MFLLNGSATTSDSASRVESAITPILPTRGRSQATGRSHTRYQGRRTGASNVNSNSPQAQAAPWTSAHAPASGVPSPTA